MVMATGLFQRAKIPAFAAGLPADVQQLHSEQYRNPASLPPGAVLVVGSGQSGCQIAEELHKSGPAGLPERGQRRPRAAALSGQGHLRMAGPDRLLRPHARQAALAQSPVRSQSPRLRRGRRPRSQPASVCPRWHDTAGPSALARPMAGSAWRPTCTRAWPKPTSSRHSARTDRRLHRPKWAGRAAGAIAGFRDGFDEAVITDLDMRAAGITSVIWAPGYSFDFSLVKLPVTDSDGFPVQQRGVTAYPGLYFVGLPWLHTQKSGLLLGVGEDAAFIAEHIAVGSANHMIALKVSRK